MEHFFRQWHFEVEWDGKVKGRDNRLANVGILQGSSVVPHRDSTNGKKDKGRGRERGWEDTAKLKKKCRCGDPICYCI